MIAETLGLKPQDFPGLKNLESLTPPPTFDRAYDLKYLRDFCDGDEEQVRHFIEKFEAQWPLEIEKLEKALRDEDREALCQAAHSFRPQLEFVGLNKVAGIAFEVEKGCRADMPWEQLSLRLNHLKVLLSGIFTFK